ncbi:hypothetical protein [Limnohabitans sp.]|uniref:hypothetical protein n=1 Tax=Limnohabitans sp. TaxID=1907725 RepID=UPI0025C625F7|nr:hypothetical protein [Limnohabitans sp.]
MSKLLDAYEQKGKECCGVWGVGCIVFFGLISYFSMHIFHEKRKTKNEKRKTKNEKRKTKNEKRKTKNEKKPRKAFTLRGFVVGWVRA